jgi:hypothetical protein
MPTIEELDDIVTTLNKKTVELYKLMGKPIPEELQEFDKELNDKG